jgi:hypothetical protein
MEHEQIMMGVKSAAESVYAAAEGVHALPPLKSKGCVFGGREVRQRNVKIEGAHGIRNKLWQTQCIRNQMQCRNKSAN